MNILIFDQKRNKLKVDTTLKFVMMFIICSTLFVCSKQADKVDKEGMWLKFGQQKYILTGNATGVYIEYFNKTTILVYGDSQSPIEHVELSFAGNEVGTNKSTSIFIYFKPPDEKGYINMAGSGFLPDAKSAITSFNNYIEGSFKGVVEKLSPRGEGTHEIVKVSGVFKVKNLQKFKH